MSEAEESQWSHFPSDILNTIATLLNTYPDVDTCTLPVPNIHKLRLRSVCKQWRSSISPPPNLPHSIIPVPIASNSYLNPSLRGHFNLSLTTIYLLQQPPLQQSSSSSSTNGKYWLLRVENTNTQNKWCPLNPLSRALTLPKGFPKSINLLNFRVSQIATSCVLDFVNQSKTHIEIELREHDWLHPDKVVVSTLGPLVAIMISGSKLYSIKVGDEKWRAVNENDSYYHDVVFHKGKFYVVDIHGRIISVGGFDLKPLEIVQTFLPYVHGGVYKNLVESNGELFLVDKCLELAMYYDEEIGASDTETDSDDKIVVPMKIYRLNEEKREWEVVNDLGDNVFFIGDDCSYSISSRDFPGLKSNCVYFFEDTFRDVNKGLENVGDFEGFGEFFGNTWVYCLDNGRCGPLAIFPKYYSPFWPPIWRKRKALKPKKWR